MLQLQNFRNAYPGTASNCSSACPLRDPLPHHHDPRDGPGRVRQRPRLLRQVHLQAPGPHQGVLQVRDHPPGRDHGLPAGPEPRGGQLPLHGGAPHRPDGVRDHRAHDLDRSGQVRGHGFIYLLGESSTEAFMLKGFLQRVVQGHARLSLI